jgi:putative SOS response-associated peptidase YedK
MCGRFTRNYTWAQIHAMYSLSSPASNLQARFNICPTTEVDVVIRGDDQRVLMGLFDAAALALVFFQREGNQPND